MEVIHESPELTSFIPLSEHQSQTPVSFYSGPPVLHHQSSDARLLVLQSDLNASSALCKLATSTSGHNGGLENNEDAEDSREVSIEGVDIWVTSEYCSFTHSHNYD